MLKTIMAVAVTAISLSVKAVDYGKYYQNLPVRMTQVSAPRIPEYTVSLKDFGGVGDGVTLNTTAFSKAISALDKKGGGHLVVPSGVWMTGLIFLKDNIDLHIEKNAVIMAAEEKSLFVKEKNGRKDAKCTPLISASKCKNISITGKGTIDGNGAQWRPVKRTKVSDVEWKEFKFMGGTETNEGQLWFPFNLKHFDNVADTPEKQEKMRAHMIRFTECENVLVEGVTLQNSPKFHLIPTRCRNVIIDGVTVRCPWNAQNGDAIDISSCKTVLIVNNVVDAGDDGICMKAGAGKSGLEYGPCEDIMIQDNTVYHAHGGFVIGSEFTGGIKNIVVRDCTFSGTDTGLRFKSGVGRGGKTEGLYISNIMMTDIKSQAIIFECTYVDRKYSVGNDGKTMPVAADAPFVPDFSDIHISGITCHNARTAISAHGLPGLKCVHNIDISSSTFFYTEKDRDMDENVELNISDTKFVTFSK